MLCFVSIGVDLPADGTAWDVGDLVGLVNEHFSCIYLTLYEFYSMLLLGNSHLRLWSTLGRAALQDVGTTQGVWTLGDCNPTEDVAPTLIGSYLKPL